MNLSELKLKSATELAEMADELGVEGISGMGKQELVFALLQAETENDGEITGAGVLQKMPDGYGFLRSSDASYLPGPDDIYVSPSQIRRFNLRTGARRLRRQQYQLYTHFLSRCLSTKKYR